MSLRLPDYLHNSIREIADSERISVNQLVTTAIAEKVSALATEKYLNAMAAKGSVEVFDSVMDKVKNRPPLPGDDLEPVSSRLGKAKRAQQTMAIQQR